MQATSQNHDQIIKTGFGITEDIFDDATAFDPREDMFDRDANRGDDRIKDLIFKSPL